MKLSDFLSDVGRPVAFYPSLVKALEDRNEAIFICQMAYWRGKGDNKDDWIYKTADEIEEETSLTYKEQINVRSGLKKKKLLKERYARTEHKMYFRVGWDEVNLIWEQFTDGHMPESKLPPSQKEGGSLPEVSSLNSITENTTENTTKEVFSKEFFEEANKLSDAIIANSKPSRNDLWKGREFFRDNHFAYADWYHEKTGQTCGKKNQRAWQKAFSDWQDENLSIDSLQQAYNARIAWKKFIVDPNELTKDAMAIQALPPVVVEDPKVTSPFASLLNYLEGANA